MSELEFFDPSILDAPPPAAHGLETFKTSQGQKITLAFEVNLGGDLNHAIHNHAGELLALYGKGGEKEGALGGAAARPVVMSFNLAMAIARLMNANVLPPNAPEGYKLWTVNQWAILAQRDEATFREIVAWLNELEDEATPDGPEGNDSGEDEGSA